MPTILKEAHRFWQSVGSSKYGAIAEQGTISAMSLAVSVLIGRACGPEALGVYALAWTIVILLCGFASSLVGIPYTIRFNQLQAETSAAKSYRGNSLIHLLILAAICVILLCITANRMPSTQLRTVMYVTAGISPLVMLRDLSRRWSFAESSVLLALETTLIAGAFQAALLLLMVASEQLSAATALACLAASCVFATIYWYSRFKRPIRIDLTNTRISIAEDWRLGKWIFAHHTSAICHVYCVLWLCKALLPSETGLLAALVTLSSIGNPLLIGLTNIYTPKFAAAFGCRQLTHRIFRTASISFCATMAFFSTLYALFGCQLAKALYDLPELDTTGKGLFVILGFRLFLASFGTAPHLLLISSQNPIKSVISVLAGLTTTCLAAPPLSSSYQLQGLLLAWLLGMVIETTAFCTFAFFQLRNLSDSSQRFQQQRSEVAPIISERR